MAYATVTLSGTYQTPDGTPHKGHVEIIPSERVIKDTTGDVILTGRVKVDLDAQGAFTVALPATDDPTLNPTGFGYTIAAKLHSSHPPAVSFSLPASLGATTVEDVTPVDPSTFEATATYAESSEVAALDSRVTTVEGDVAGKANSADLATVATTGNYTDLTGQPNIPTTAADIGATDLTRHRSERAPLDLIEGMYAAGFPMLVGVPPTVTFHGPGGQSPITTPTLIPYDTAQVTKIGCKPELRTQYSTNYWKNGVNGNWTAPPWAVEFDTDATDFALRFRTEVAGNTSFWITVDGYPITRDPIVPSANVAPGSLSWMRLQFSGAARMRRIRVHMMLADFGGLDTPAGVTVTATTVPGKKVVFLGDSWTEGSSQSPYPYTFANVCARIFGWQPFLCGQGGTGYATAGAGGGREKFGAANRLADIYAVTPDYIVVAGSQNDDGLATIQADAAALFSALNTNLPGTKVLVVGPQAGITTANRLANRDAVKAAALAAPNVTAFIDPIAGDWITGTGKITDRKGDGNRDYVMGADSTHPSMIGGRYYGRRTAEALLVEMIAAGLPY